MDKRYFVIIIILTIGCVNMFIIANSSDIVGSASVSFDKYVVSIPNNFILMNNYDNWVVINNPESGLYVTIYVHDNNYSSKNVIDEVKNKNTLLSEGNIDINNITVNSIYYLGSDSNGNLRNRSIFFFEKYNSKFEVQMANFNYDHHEETIDTLILIVNSLRMNYKMI